MASRLWLSRSAVLVLGLLSSVTAAAEEPWRRPPLIWHPDVRAPPQADVNEPADDTAAGATEAGHLQPFTLSAAIPRSHAVGMALFGYDTVTSSSRARGAAEARVLDFLALRVDYEHGPGSGGDDRVGVGARVGLLSQAKYGIDLGAGLFYRPKDFREEGNVVGALLVGRHFGRLGLFGNAMFGTDPEGDDQSVALSISSSYRLGTSAHLGLDARGRFNLSTDAKRFQTRTVDYELQGGPLASVCFDRVALLAMLGPSVLALAEPTANAESSIGRTRVGFLTLAGAGGAF